jgi:hypothetical protein
MQTLSPELVLVGDEFRAEAIAALPERSWELFAARGTTASRMPEDEPPGTAPSADVALIARIIVYTAWHALLGVFLGFGVVLAVVLGLLALGLFVG